MTAPDETAPTETKGRGVWLALAAVAVIAVPSFAGYLLLRDDKAPPAASAVVSGTQAAAGGGMGGAAAPADSGVTTALPAGVLDFSEIQASDIVIEPDPAGGAAVLRVTTSIDVACAVSYGQTAALGDIATDSDMAGGGHTDHHPVMGGLAGDTTYFYRVSAIGPDGTLYQSDVMQFISSEASTAAPAAPSVQPPAPNIAANARVTDVSSQFSDSYGGANAIDGSLSTEWSSLGDGDDAYIVVEFDEEMIVEGVGFRTREMSDGTSITTSFTVTVDNKTTHGPFEAGPGLSVGLVDFVGKKIRFDVETSTGGNTGAIEVEVYGEPDM